MVALIAVTVVAVSAGVIATTQVLGASNRGDPVAVPPQSSIRDATPSEPPRTRSRPSVFCHRDGRPVDCVRWIQPLEERLAPRVMATPLGPLLHSGAQLTLHDPDTGTVRWTRDLRERNGHVVGIMDTRSTPAIILALGERLVFFDLGTGAPHGDHRPPQGQGFFDAILIGDNAVHTTTVRYAPDGRPDSVIVVAWTLEGPAWEVNIVLDVDGDHGPWGEIVDTTRTEVVVRTQEAIVSLDATTGEEQWRRQVQPGDVIADGDVLLRSSWDYQGRPTSTLHAEDLGSGQALWARDLRASAHWWRIESGRVAVFDRPHLVVLDTRTGEVQWTLPLATGAELMWGLPVDTGVVVLADPATNQLRGIEAATGEELWREASPRTLPSDLPWSAAGDDYLVMRHPQQDGYFLLDRQTGQVAIDLRTDGRFAGDAWDLHVRWPILQSRTGHLYLVSVDVPAGGG